MTIPGPVTAYAPNLHSTTQYLIEILERKLCRFSTLTFTWNFSAQKKNNLNDLKSARTHRSLPVRCILSGVLLKSCSCERQNRYRYMTFPPAHHTLDVWSVPLMQDYREAWKILAGMTNSCFVFYIVQNPTSFNNCYVKFGDNFVKNWWIFSRFNYRTHSTRI